MLLVEIGTAGAITYFIRHITSDYSLNVSDPIEGQPVQLLYYLCVFGCGLVFWLLVLLRAKLHGSGDGQADIRKVAKLAKLITLITTLNLCGGLLAPFMKLPLLVRFLVLFQVSSNLALLLIWAFLSLKECMILPDPHTRQQQKSSPEPQAAHGSLRSLPKSGGGSCENLSKSRGGYSGYPRFSGQIKRKLSKFSSAIGSITNYERVPDYLGISQNIQVPAMSDSNFHCSFDCNIHQTPVAQSVATRKGVPVAVHEVDLVSGKVDEAGGSGSGHGSGASGREENRGRYGGNDGGGGAGGGGDRGASGSGHGSAASGSGENSGGYWGHGRDEGGTGSGHGSGASGREENRGRYGGNDGGGGAGGGGDRGASGGGHGSGASGSGENSGGYGGHGRDEGGTGSGHGSGPGGTGENRGGSEGGNEGGDGGGADPECGGRGTNTEQAFKSSKITEMSLMLTAQTTAALIGFHLMTPSSSSKALLVVVLIDQLVAYLCGLTSILLSSNKPEDSKAAKIFADIGFVCTALGFILMVAMFVPWYLVLIAVLLFGVVWLIFFRNGLKTRATEVWNYLKNACNL